VDQVTFNWGLGRSEGDVDVLDVLGESVLRDLDRAVSYWLPRRD
jgi:hypothetical protein